MGPYHDPNIIGYYIYRYVTPIPVGTPILDKIAVTGHEYYDTEFTFGSSEHHVEYWIKARINSTQESDVESNHVFSTGEFTPYKQGNSETEKTENYITTLKNNHPNPFNPTTTITYSLAKPVHVNLSVYNSIGQLVEVLVNNFEEEGYYSVLFNAGNFPSGVYYYKLQTDYYAEVKKMVVAK